jgi:hypothetical protein
MPRNGVVSEIVEILSHYGSLLMLFKVKVTPPSSKQISDVKRCVNDKSPKF